MERRSAPAAQEVGGAGVAQDARVDALGIEPGLVGQLQLLAEALALRRPRCRARRSDWLSPSA